MNVFGIGLPEMALIFVLALLVFGPKKLPEIGRTLGKTIRGFQDASKEFEQEFKRAADSIEETVQEAPMKATLEPPAQLSPANDIPDATVTEIHPATESNTAQPVATSATNADEANA